MKPPQRLQRSEYKQPSRINPVSISLLLIAGAMGYFGWCVWPVLALRSGVKNELNGVLPQIWRMNLRPESTAKPELIRIKKVLTQQLRAMGVKDKRLEVIFTRDKKMVSAQANFTATAFFPYINKKWDIACSPRSETDAARIEW